MNTPMYLKLFISPHSDSEIKEIVKKEKKRRRVKIADSDLSEFME